jgi:two-component system response regulator YesN
VFKAIIVDDEKWICQLISKIIEWDNLGIELSGQVEDGIAALDLIRSVQPDIVITDIKMPGIDGLEIIKRTREMGLETTFIIISGYKYFEYAYNAIKYGVEDYLLKPIKKAELTNVLAKIINKLSEKQKRETEEVQIKNKLANSNNKLREQFLNKLFSSSNEHIEYNLSQINSDYNLKFNDGLYNTIKFKLDEKSDEPVSESFQRICKERIYEVVYNNLGDKCYDCQLIDNFTFILNYSETNRDVIKSKIKLVFEELTKFLGIANLYTLTIGVGKEVDIFNDIVKTNRASEDAIKSRIVEGLNRIIYYSSLEYEEKNLDELFTEKNERQFINIIEILDQNSLRDFVSDIFDNLSKNEKINPVIYFKLAEKLYQVFSSTIYNISIKTITEEQNISDIDLSKYKSISEIKNGIIKSFVKELGIYLDLYNSRVNAPVRLVKNYISENYNKTISLTQIAELVNLNPVYLSIIFKKELGMNFSDYLINYRIDKAKQLLKEIQYNISQVSEMIGYSDPKYFSKLFKKIVGINPINYRKIHL